MSLDSDETKKPKSSRALKVFLVLVASLSFLVLATSMYIYHQSTAPSTFKSGTSFEIQPGMNVRTIADHAQKQGLVRSDVLLYALLTYSHDPTSIFAGNYVFKEPTNVFGVANKLANKDIENKLVRITLPEGITAKEMAAIAERTLPDFDTYKYLTLAETEEGYLYPETYFIPETFTADQLLDLQKQTFNDAIAPVKDEITESDFSLYEVLILASLIEREANDQESMRFVSSVLQNRLEIGMPLQADASIEYVLDKPLSELTPADLKIDTPYNTYLNTGLMPTPIGNPGLQAIKSVLTPAESNYLFYITDNNGNFHYAETFSEHNRNIAKYLR
jgi:UPF0755 protein